MTAALRRAGLPAGRGVLLAQIGAMRLIRLEGAP